MICIRECYAVADTHILGKTKVLHYYNYRLPDNEIIDSQFAKTPANKRRVVGAYSDRGTSIQLHTFK